MSDQPPTLFPNPRPKQDPTKVETYCWICGATFLFDVHGVARHRPGDGRRCDDILRARIQAARQKREDT